MDRSASHLEHSCRHEPGWMGKWALDSRCDENYGETGSRDPNGIEIPVAARVAGDSMIIERPCGRIPAQIRLELSLGNCLSPNNRLRDFKTVRKNHGSWDWGRDQPTEATQGLDTTSRPLPVVFRQPVLFEQRLEMFRRRWELRRVSLPAIPPSPATHQWSCPGCTRR